MGERSGEAVRELTSAWAIQGNSRSYTRSRNRSNAGSSTSVLPIVTARAKSRSRLIAKIKYRMSTMVSSATLGLSVLTNPLISSQHKESVFPHFPLRPLLKQER